MDPEMLVLLIVALGMAQVSGFFTTTGLHRFAVPKQCTTVKIVPVVRYVPYQESYDSRNLFGFKRRKQRTNFRKEIHNIHETHSVCCSGYVEDTDKDLCLPVCRNGTGCGSHGSCAQPERCHCEPGYAVGQPAGNGPCEPVCTEGCHGGGVCTAPDTCECPAGHRLHLDGWHCTPVCEPYCDNLEYCAEPGVCRCINGYARKPADRAANDATARIVCTPVCKQDCASQNAECVEPNRCRCRLGYVELEHDNDDDDDDDDDADKLQYKDNEHDEDEDFKGCAPVCPGLPGYRGGCAHGRCVAPNSCECEPGYRNNSDAYGRVTCEPVCSFGCVNATCIEPEICTCWDGYASSADNGMAVVEVKATTPNAGPYVCRPYCSSGCPHGNCRDPETCDCEPGYRSTGSTCEPVCDPDCGMGKCVEPERCSCDAGYAPSGTADGGPCRAVCSGCSHGRCVAPDVCICEVGYERRPRSRPEPKTPADLPVDRDHGNKDKDKDKDDDDDNEDDEKIACLPVCECENGYCDDEGTTCVACHNGYELRVVVVSNESSGVTAAGSARPAYCAPRCASGCAPGRCVAPERCACPQPDYYEVLGKPGEEPRSSFCARSCAGDCGQHGRCREPRASCECARGWTGKFCERPSHCALTLPAGFFQIPMAEQADAATAEVVDDIINWTYGLDSTLADVQASTGTPDGIDSITISSSSNDISSVDDADVNDSSSSSIEPKGLTEATLAAIAEEPLEERPWNGPTCSERCWAELVEPRNCETLNGAGDDDNDNDAAGYVCYFSIDAPCNARVEPSRDDEPSRDAKRSRDAEPTDDTSSIADFNPISGSMLSSLGTSTKLLFVLSLIVGLLTTFRH